MIAKTVWRSARFRVVADFDTWTERSLWLDGLLKHRAVKTDYWRTIRIIDVELRGQTGVTVVLEKCRRVLDYQPVQLEQAETVMKWMKSKLEWSDGGSVVIEKLGEIELQRPPEWRRKGKS